MNIRKKGFTAMLRAYEALNQKAISMILPQPSQLCICICKMMAAASVDVRLRGGAFPFILGVAGIVK
jgi:hypothetical protein